MSKVQALVQLPAYQQSRAHLFPSIESARWFVRKNKPALIAAGAILQIAGRTQIEPETFDRVVIEIGQRAAEAEAA